MPPDRAADASGLSDADVERRAVRGVGYLLGRSIAVQALAALGTVGLARLLDPSDYGAFAVAFAAQQVGRYLVEFGLGSALVRRDQSPTIAEQRAVAGVTTLIACAICGLAVVVAFVLISSPRTTSQLPELIALASLALPFYSLRIVPAALLERSLQFQRLVFVDIGETLGFYGFALAAAASGLGAYSLIGGLVVGAGVSALAATLLQPWARRLSLRIRYVRPLARFSAQAGAVVPIYLLAELGFVSLVSSLGGQALAGYYGISQRLLSLPIAIASTVFRVGLPAFSRTAPGPNREIRAARVAALTATAASLPLAVITGASSPIINILFGEAWLPAAEIVTVASAGILVAASLGAVLHALALANGDATTPLVATVGQAVVAIGSAIALVPDMAATGVGVSSALALAASPLIMLVRSSFDARVGALAVFRALAICAGSAAMSRSLVSGNGGLALIGSIAIAVATWIVLSLALNRDDVRAVMRLVRRHSRPTRAIVAR